jgi:hypothetical protein
VLGVNQPRNRVCPAKIDSHDSNPSCRVSGASLLASPAQ